MPVLDHERGVLGHFSAQVPGQRPVKFFRQRYDGAGDCITNSLGALPGERRNSLEQEKAQSLHARQNDRYRPDNGLAEGPNIAGGIPPAFRNQRAPTGADVPADAEALSLLIPWAIPDQNRCSLVREADGAVPVTAMALVPTDVILVS